MAIKFLLNQLLIHWTISRIHEKAILKKKGVAGLSKMKAADLNQALADHFTEEELSGAVHNLGLSVDDKGKQALQDYQAGHH